jgi:hypothetical protein
MSFLKTKKFKYVKNLIIGVGAAVVLLGALFKLESWEGASLMLTIGLFTEAFIFFFLGVVGPEPDYYWHKLYPGLEDYNSNIAPLTQGEIDDMPPALNGEVVEQQLGGMLTELQAMSKNLSSLQALQEIDFSGTSEQVRTMNNFYTKLNEAMADLGDSLEDTKIYKDQLAVLNKNLGSLNSVYGNVLTAMSNIRHDA